jgi:hypothetical protein
MKRLLLVFDDGTSDELNLQSFVDSLDSDAQMYAMDGHVCFLKTTLSASEISDKFLKFAGSRLFFVSDITTSDFSGRMLGVFFDFMKGSALTAAE